MLLCENVLAEENRLTFWRKISYVDSKLLFILWGLHIRKENAPKTSGPYVYACNHPAAFDGFTCFGLVGPNVTMLTGPRKMFPYPFSFWFKKSGAIDVMRDWYDNDHYKEGDSYPIPQAIEKMVERLKGGESVFMFVEGHVERSGRLQYVHTGAARIALRAKVPVVPLTLVGVQKLIRRNEMRPGSLRVVFGDPIVPPKMTRDRPFRKAVKQYRDQIYKKIQEQLPHKYQQHLFNFECRPDVGVFVDIDNTLYQGYSMKDFFVWLVKRGDIQSRAVWKIRMHVILSAVGVTNHEEMMRKIAQQFAGWKTKELKRLAQLFFHEVGRLRYNHHLMAFMKDHQECDHTIVLISESIQPLAECFKELVGAQRAYGSLLESKGGMYTGRIKRLMYGEQKRDCAERFATQNKINLKESFAYSDSMSDLPIFKLVGHPVVVDPHEKMLLSLAQKRHWEVVQ
jgi:HAD superfamily hydrolase (TIGR01490 family)